MLITLSVRDHPYMGGLAIPASSSKSEHVFSCAGNDVTSKRTRLNANKVEMLVVLKQNNKILREYEQ